MMWVSRSRFEALERRVAELEQLLGARPVGGFPPGQAAWPAMVPPGAFGGRMDEVRSLLREGKKIAAIKAYREATGVGLAEAKNAVEALERDR
jgi:ribosomal protein L7/L12